MNARCKLRPWAYFQPLTALGFAALLLAGCGSDAKSGAADAANAPTAAVVKVQRRNLSSELSVASEFQPRQEVDVYAKVSGYIKKLYVDWGTHVQQGQILAVLEIPELEQQLQQDEAGVKKSEQDAERAKEDLSARGIGVHRCAPYVFAARGRAEIAPRADGAGGNRRRPGKRP